MKKSLTKNLVLSAMFVALGLVMPFLTGQIPEIGSMLLPMHFPVLLAGFILGWKYGLAVGFITPLLRSVTFGMPPLFPTATAMAFELAAYAVVAGLLYAKLPKKVWSIYVALIASMLVGRLIWGGVSALLFLIKGNAFTWQIFIGGAVLKAIPGIIAQIVLIPIIIMILSKANLIEPLQNSVKTQENVEEV